MKFKYTGNDVDIVGMTLRRNEIYDVTDEITYERIIKTLEAKIIILNDEEKEDKKVKKNGR